MDGRSVRQVSGDEALAELRERLGWHEQVPRIEEMHPLAIEMTEEGAKTVLMCCHDSANDSTHQLLIEREALGDPIDPDDPEQVAAAYKGDLGHINFVLSAGWN